MRSNHKRRRYHFFDFMMLPSLVLCILIHINLGRSQNFQKWAATTNCKAIGCYFNLRLQNGFYSWKRRKNSSKWIYRIQLSLILSNMFMALNYFSLTSLSPCYHRTGFIHEDPVCVLVSDHRYSHKKFHPPLAVGQCSFEEKPCEPLWTDKDWLYVR